MKPLSKTATLLLGALVTVLVLIGMYVLLFSAMKNKTSSADAVTAKNKDLTERAARTTSLENTFKAESVNIDKLSTHFVKESEVVLFTKEVEALGGASGTKLTLDSLEPGVAAGNIPVLNFRITATGSFANIMRLELLLENFPAKLEWKSVSLVQLDTTGGISSWRIELVLSALNFVKG